MAKILSSLAILAKIRCHRSSDASSVNMEFTRQPLGWITIYMLNIGALGVPCDTHADGDRVMTHGADTGELGAHLFGRTFLHTGVNVVQHSSGGLACECGRWCGLVRGSFRQVGLKLPGACVFTSLGVIHRSSSLSLH